MKENNCSKNKLISKRVELVKMCKVNKGGQEGNILFSCFRNYQKNNGSFVKRKWQSVNMDVIKASLRYVGKDRKTIIDKKSGGQ